MRSPVSWRLGAALAAALSLAAVPTVALAHESRDLGELHFVVGFLNEPAFEGEPNGASVRITRPAQEDGMSMGDGPDVEAHGMVFTSQPVDGGGHFEFTFGHEYEDIEVPYHVHPSNAEGSVTVSHDAPNSGEVMVMLTEAGLSEPHLMVQPDTTVRWMNESGAQVVFMSGLLSGSTSSGSGVSVPVTGVAASIQVEVTHVPMGTQKTMALREAFGDPGHYVANFIPTSPGTYRFRFFGTIDGQEINETFASSPTTFNDIEAATAIQFPVVTGSTRELESAVRGASDAAASAEVSAADASSSASTATTLAIVGLVVGIAGVGAGAGGLLMAMRKG